MIFPNTFRRFRFLNATAEVIDVVDVYYATDRDIAGQWIWIPAMNPIAGVQPFRGLVEITGVPNNTLVKAVRVVLTKNTPTPLNLEGCEQACVYEAQQGTYVGEALFLFENDTSGQSAYRVTLEVAGLHTQNPDDWHYTGHEHYMPEQLFLQNQALRANKVAKGQAKKASEPDGATATKTTPSAPVSPGSQGRH